MRVRFVPGRRRHTAVALALLVVVGMPTAAPAHNQPIPIDIWGPFLPGAQGCLRAISRAVHTCFDVALALEHGCNDALLRGESCDRETVDEAIDDAANATRVTLANSCTLGQLTELGYIGFFDAQSDLTSACVTQARAAISATYAPTRFGAGTPSAAAVQCMVASAAYSRKVMRFLLERETPIMERIATRLMTVEEKKASVLRVERELSAARPRWAAGVLEACPDFATVYGRSAESFVRTLKQVTDCVLALNYVHTAIACINQVCGNGIPEGIEACDDGNSDNTDLCRTDCTANS